jgi:fructose-bisphosphate aldolase, class I
MESVTVDTSEELQATINDLTQNGKGILAADESVGTATKRLTGINVESTEENRRRYRTMLLTTPGMEEFVSGVILFEETLYQKDDNGVLLPDVLKNNGVVPGIKVDKGTVQFNGSEVEKFTQGLEGLGDRLIEYKKAGARFAKWRATYSIGDSLPTDELVAKNAEDLAKYAKICQENGIVPIVEPEVLIDGTHSIEKCNEITGKVLAKVFEALDGEGVVLKHIVLKPSMVISGKSAENRAGRKEVAAATVDLFREVVPIEVPTINFLSGGQAPEEATQHLQEMNVLEKPWILSFSYGRALQEPALNTWLGNDENKEAAQQAFYKRAKLNSLAVKGEYTEELETT